MISIFVDVQIGQPDKPDVTVEVAMSLHGPTHKEGADQKQSISVLPFIFFSQQLYGSKSLHQGVGAGVANGALPALPTEWPHTPSVCREALGNPCQAL